MAGRKLKEIAFVSEDPNLQIKGSVIHIDTFLALQEKVWEKDEGFGRLRSERHRIF